MRNTLNFFELQQIVRSNRKNPRNKNQQNSAFHALLQKSAMTADNIEQYEIQPCFALSQTQIDSLRSDVLTNHEKTFIAYGNRINADARKYNR